MKETRSLWPVVCQVSLDLPHTPNLFARLYHLHLSCALHCRQLLQKIKTFFEEIPPAGKGVVSISKFYWNSNKRKERAKELLDDFKDFERHQQVKGSILSAKTQHTREGLILSAATMSLVPSHILVKDDKRHQCHLNHRPCAVCPHNIACCPACPTNLCTWFR